MSSPKKLKAISLDLDGTLYRVRKLRVAWRLRRELGLVRALLDARETMRREPPYADRAALEAREVELIASARGLTSEEATLRLAALRGALPAALTRGVAPYPGVLATLEHASARGLELAVLSDYDPGEKLALLGLSTIRFRVVLGADACGAIKPHTRAFLRVAEQLGVEPREVLHIGDREDLDVEGALKAGFRAWRFAPRAEVTSRAERVFARWSVDLLPLLTEGASPR